MDKSNRKQQLAVKTKDGIKTLDIPLIMNESFIEIDKENEIEESFEITCNLCDIRVNCYVNDDLTIDNSELTKHLKTKKHLFLEKKSLDSHNDENESDACIQIDDENDCEDDFNEWLTYKMSNGSKRNIKIPIELTEPYFEYAKREIYDEMFEIKCTLCFRKLNFNLKYGFNALKAHIKNETHKKMLKQLKQKNKKGKENLKIQNLQKKSHFIEPIQTIGDEKVYKIIKFKNKHGELKEVKHNPKLDMPYFIFEKKKIYDESVEITCNLCYSKFNNRFESHWSSLYSHLKSEKHKGLAVKFEREHKDTLGSSQLIETNDQKESLKRKLSTSSNKLLKVDDVNDAKRFKSSSTLVSTEDIVNEEDSQNDTPFDQFNFIEESNENTCSSGFQGSISFDKFIALAEVAVAALNENEINSFHQNDDSLDENMESRNKENDNLISDLIDENTSDSNCENLQKQQNTDSNNNIIEISNEIVNIQQKDLKEENKILIEQLMISLTKLKNECNQYEKKYNNLFKISKNKDLNNMIRPKFGKIQTRCNQNEHLFNNVTQLKHSHSF